VIDAVLKIGGSLGRGPFLLPLCERIAALGVRHRLAIVPGGGVFADVVRAEGSRHRLGDAAQHWMAVLAMDAFGHLLADLIPRAAVVSTLEETERCLNADRVAVILSYELLHAADPLPHSWAVTSDSIALWIGGTARADRVVLIKDRWGAAGLGVDRHLVELRADAACGLWIVNGERPAELEALLDGDASEGTRVW